MPLADGETKEIIVRMARGGVITGVLLDHNNQPAGSATVTAMRYRILNGERRLVPAGTARTDDRGSYRIFGLAAGDYLVTGGATRFERGFAPSELLLTTDADVRYARGSRTQAPPPPRRSVTFGSTYFPGTAVASQAGIISLATGEERVGSDFALQLLPTVHVEGTVSLPGGPVPPGTEVSLVSTAPAGTMAQAGMTYRTVRTAGDGGFTIADVLPGQFTVLARGKLLQQNVWASTQIGVDMDNVTGLALSLEPGLTISGQVRFEGTLKPPGDLRSIQVMAMPDERQSNVAFAPARVNVMADGRFSIPGATPGPYRLTASFPGSGRPGSWLLKSVSVNGQDAFDASFTLEPNQHLLDATITFTDRLAQVSGTVRGGAGGAAPDYTVIVFPAEPSLWLPQSRRIQGVRPAADGAYLVRGLPAGTYLLAAVDEAEPGEWFDPWFLQRLIPGAVRATVADGEQKVQDIRLGPAGKPIDR